MKKRESNSRPVDKNNPTADGKNRQTVVRIVRDGTFVHCYLACGHMLTMHSGEVASPSSLDCWACEAETQGALANFSRSAKLIRGDHRLQRLAADQYSRALGLQDLSFLEIDERPGYGFSRCNGKKEIIAQGNGLGPCGGTGNCIVMVLQRAPTRWRTLLDTQAQLKGRFEKIRVLDAFTDGCRDIVVASHVSACERTASLPAYEKEQD